MQGKRLRESDMSTISNDPYEAELKVALEAHYGGPIEREVFEHWLEEAFPTGPPDYAMKISADVATMINAIELGRTFIPARRRPRTAKARDFKAEPPVWWVDHTAALVESYRSTQFAILRLFGLPTPLDVHEQDDLIAELVAHQCRDGLSVFLHHHNSMLSGFGGLRIPELSEVWFPLEAPALDFVAAPELARPFALFFLASESQRMADATGCEQAAAIDFLLSDIEPDIPWIWVMADDFGSPAINVRVGSVAVTPAEVMKAYGEALEQWRQVDSQLFLLAPKRRRRSRRRTLALLAFIDEHSPEGERPRDWPSLREKWNELRPDWEFPSEKAMYEAFRRAKRSRGDE